MTVFPPPVSLMAVVAAPVTLWKVGEYPCSTSIVSPQFAAPLSWNVEVTPFVRLFAERSLNPVISSPRLVNKPALSLAFWSVPPT